MRGFVSRAGSSTVTKTSSQDRKLQRTLEQMLAVESCADDAMKRSDRSILESDDESQRHGRMIFLGKEGGRFVVFGGFDRSKGWRSALFHCRQGKRSLTLPGALLCCGRTHVDKTRTSVILEFV